MTTNNPFAARNADQRKLITRVTYLTGEVATLTKQLGASHPHTILAQLALAAAKKEVK